jgi:riboflavin kinase/FMN adenylyltransferase
MKAIVVGEDYSYGSRRKGNLTSLKKDAKQYDFEVILVPGVQFILPEMGRISSTRIRELVMDGNVSEAQKLLGRHYQIRGEGCFRTQSGRKLLGFPTPISIFRMSLP